MHKDPVSTCIDCGEVLYQKAGPGRLKLRCDRCRPRDNRVFTGQVTEVATPLRGSVKLHGASKARVTECIDCHTAIQQNGSKGAPRLRCEACIREYKNASRRAYRRGELYKRCLACSVPMAPAAGFTYCENCRPKPALHVIRAIECPVCKLQFETDTANQVYCSELCRIRFKTAKKLRRPYTRVPTDRDRARWVARAARRKAMGIPNLRKGGAWRAVRLQVLAEESVCWLCELPIDPALRYPDRMSGSVDHVTPVVLGGTNDRDNLRAAHFQCNNRRNSRAVTTGV